MTATDAPLTGEQLDKESVRLLSRGRKRPVHVERYHKVSCSVGRYHKVSCDHRETIQLYADTDYCCSCGRPVRKE